MTRHDEPTEGDVACLSCEGVVDRTLPTPIPEGYELMWTEAFAQRALYCQACFEEGQ